MLLELFEKGGWAMWPLLVLLIFGIAVAIERAYSLFKAAIDADKFFTDLESTLRSSGADKAAEFCSETPGPVASVIHAGLVRLHRGLDHAEKAIENSGAVEMAFLERGMVWLSTVANLAPMIGFLGTVSGMINAFRKIEELGDVEPSAVAGGISEALITTASGLVVGIIIQFCYNFFANKIDRIIADMQEHTAAFVDILAEMIQEGKIATGEQVGTEE
jgi:biopolymer transport protein ExbB|tara:strand:+ start:265 stop:918 length:654 start_codon:yes stop_codon:yes gene_type:complete